MGGILRALGQAIRDGQRSRRSHGKTIDDPVFGRLTYDRAGLWAGTLSLRHFGDHVEVSVDASAGEPPTEAQRRACRALIDDEERLYRAVEQANFAFYNELVLGNWRRQELEAHPEDEAVILREMPDVDDPSLLWKWLTDPSLHVPNQEGDGWVVELFWDCRWDEEHGHRVAIRDGEVTTDVDE